jgi:hypothetical protein
MLFPLYPLLGDLYTSGQVPYEQWTNYEQGFSSLQIACHKMCSIDYEAQLDDSYLYPCKMSD